MSTAAGCSEMLKLVLLEFHSGADETSEGAQAVMCGQYYGPAASNLREKICTARNASTETR
jgi:hypothetical protein